MREGEASAAACRRVTSTISRVAMSAAYQTSRRADDEPAGAASPPPRARENINEKLKQLIRSCRKPAHTKAGGAKLWARASRGRAGCCPLLFSPGSFG